MLPLDLSPDSTPEELAARLPSIEIVQQLLTYYSYLKGHTFAKEADAAHAHTVFHRYMAEKEQLERDLPGFREFVNAMHPENPMKREKEHELYQMERKLRKVNDLLNRFVNHGLIMKAFVQEQEKKMDKEYIMRRVMHIGRWFEEGHLGPGSVKCDWLTFTAK